MINLSFKSKSGQICFPKNPLIFIGKVQKLETATKNFLTQLKEKQDAIVCNTAN